MAKKTADKSLKEAAKVLKAAGHPARLAIAGTLLQGAKTVGNIQSALGLSQPNLSQHLALLKRVGLIQSYASGPLRCYYLVRPTLAQDLLALARKEHKVVAAPRDRIVTQAVAGGAKRRRAVKKTAARRAPAKRARASRGRRRK